MLSSGIHPVLVTGGPVPVLVHASCIDFILPACHNLLQHSETGNQNAGYFVADLPVNESMIY